MFLRNREFRWAFKLSIPTLFAYFPLGVVFGLLFVNTGFDWYLAPIMSILNYSGAVQFVALSMMANHASVSAIIVATVFIALRNSFYGISFLERYNVTGFKKVFLMFTLVDANYAVLLANPPEPELNDLKCCYWLSGLFYFYWVAGTFIGALCAKWVPPFPALQFILPCFFMVLLIEYYLAKRKLHILILPAILSLIAYLIMPSQYLLVAIVLSIVTILIINRIERKDV